LHSLVVAFLGFGACTKAVSGPPAVAPDRCEDVGGVTRCVITEGPGPIVEPGPVELRYTGWLSDGTKFDSSIDKGRPFTFELGAGKVIRGWDLAVEGMRYGGRYLITVPPELGYGARGAGGVIPPHETLTFEIEPLRTP